MENAKKLASYHVLFHHHEADGWITVARKEGKKWIQEHYKSEKLALKLSEWLGEDVYELAENTRDFSHEMNRLRTRCVF